MKRTQIKGVVILLLTALIWGSSFMAQSFGMEKIEAFTFNGIRTVLGAIVLLPVVIFRQRRSTKKLFTKKNVLSMVLLGTVFCLACNLQQFAFYYSTAGKIAFITALYMFFVPIISVFIGKKIRPITWVYVGVGFVGLYLLCIGPSGFESINLGDVLTLLCAVMYAIHILLIDKLAQDIDGVTLSFAQFAFSGVVSCILMFIFETPVMSNIIDAGVPILYAGIMSCGLAYTFQIIGQKYTPPTVASLLMCMESVFAVLTQTLFGIMMSPRELIGCLIMFVAIILSQLSTEKKQGIQNNS